MSHDINLFSASWRPKHGRKAECDTKDHLALSRPLDDLVKGGDLRKKHYSAVGKKLQVSDLQDFQPELHTNLAFVF